jgi:hypothetical protein
MRSTSAIVPLAIALTVSACGNESEQMVTERVTTVDAGGSSNWSGGPPPPPPPPPPNAPVPPPPAPQGGEQESSADIRIAPAAIPQSAPKIAYIYSYGFRVPADRIAPMQQRHADMCEALGPQQCRIISMSNNGSEGEYARGDLQIAVVADRARAFGSSLAQAVEDADGEQVSAAISGEDLSKQMVDTEARLRARTALRDRLMEVLETRRGTVAELVEAERGVAQVNEEIDQARSWLAEMETRVAFSRINLGYESGVPESGGFMDPIRSAFGSLGSILGVFIAALIVITAIVLPIALIVFGLLYLRRRFWPREESEVDVQQSTRADEAIEPPA